MNSFHYNLAKYHIAFFLPLTYTSAGIMVVYGFSWLFSLPLFIRALIISVSLSLSVVCHQVAIRLTSDLAVYRGWDVETNPIAHRLFSERGPRFTFRLTWVVLLLVYLLVLFLVLVHTRTTITLATSVSVVTLLINGLDAVNDIVASWSFGKLCTNRGWGLPVYPYLPYPKPGRWNTYEVSKNLEQIQPTILGIII